MDSNGNTHNDDPVKQRPATDSKESAVRLFLSYAGVDRTYARTVAKALEAAQGVELFWDKNDQGWGIAWGDEWQKKLEEALLDCDAFLLLVSPGGVRNWTLAETQVALSRHFGAKKSAGKSYDTTGKEIGKDDSSKDNSKRLLILPLLLPKATTDLLPPFLDLFQAETWPVEYPPDDAQAFARWLLPRLRARLDNRQVGPDLPRIKLKEGQNPFRGLASYREEDAPFFFGRQVDTVDLLHCLGCIERGRRRRWLQIEGESGSGKSSLIHAGLLPAIRRGWRGFNDGFISDCVILEPMRPGKDVLRELATALYRAPGNKQLSSKAIKDALCTDGDEVLAHYLRDLRPSKSHALLLVIDQFEELLTVAENMIDVRRFDRQLAAALEDEGTGLYLITGVRSDLLNFDDLPRLQNCLNNLGIRRQFNKVNERQLREIIFDLPAALGLEWSDRELPKEILALALKEPAPLPTLQFILDHLWKEGDHRRLERRLFDPKHSDSLGQKLGQAAEELLNSLDGNRDHALNLLLQLTVRQGDGYARRSLDYTTAVEAAGGGKEGEGVILRLSGQRDKDNENKVSLRLLTVTPGAADAEKSVELIHEILLRDRLPPKDASKDALREGVWPTLWNHLELNRKRYHDRELLRLRVERWSQTRGWSGLASRSELRDFRRVSPDDKEQTARYLSRSWWRHRLTELGAAILLILAVWIVDAALWINEYGFPMNYMPVRMMSWLGVIPKPDMVEIKPGTVRIGSETAHPDEPPVREITIANGFRIGRYEISFYQYDFYAIAMGKKPPFGVFGRGSQPVISVNLNEGWCRDYRG